LIGLSANLTPAEFIVDRHPEVAARSALTRVFDALWRPSKDAEGPSPFEARPSAEHLRVTDMSEQIIALA
jgi:hypothetical protein